MKPWSKILALALSASVLAGFVLTINSIALAQPVPDAGPPKLKRENFPCPGCATILPSTYSTELPAPMLVLLHGDEGSVRVVVRLWEKALEKRGIILLALRCPKSLGCASSFWQWQGDFDWIAQQSQSIIKTHAVDRERVYLSGWSGGSTYMGMMEPKLSDIFAALNLNGGGAPPSGPDCGACKMPVYYFMGGKNPLIQLAERTRDHFQGCGHPLEWDFHPSLNHGGELRLLSAESTQTRILDWLLNQNRKKNKCGPDQKASGLESPPSPPAQASVPAPATSPPPPIVAPPSASRGGCGCAFVGVQYDAIPARLAPAMAFLLLLPRLKSRRRPHRLQIAPHNRGEGLGISQNSGSPRSLWA